MRRWLEGSEEMVGRGVRRWLEEVRRWLEGSEEMVGGSEEMVGRE